MRNDGAALPVALIGAGLAAAAGFGILSRAVYRHDLRGLDGAARKRVPKRPRRLIRLAADGIGPLGKWWGQMPITAAVAALAWRRGGARASVPMLAASATAATAAWALEQTMPHRAPPPGRHSPTEPAFPSGHALQTTAVAWTMAYVLLRENGKRAGAAIPFAALIPLASGAAKIYRDKHWLTDVLGGYLLGMAIAAPAAAGYELAAPRRSPHARRAREIARAARKLLSR